jgi:hypothetical protein
MDMVSYDIRTIDADGEYPFDCDIDCTSCETVKEKGLTMPPNPYYWSQIYLTMPLK